MKTILVIGASGFVGRRLTKALLAEGHAIRCLLPRGAVKGLVDSLRTDAVGDPAPIRAILPRPLLSFRQATERALFPIRGV